MPCEGLQLFFWVNFSQITIWSMINKCKKFQFINVLHCMYVSSDYSWIVGDEYFIKNAAAFHAYQLVSVGLMQVLVWGRLIYVLELEHKALIVTPLWWSTDIYMYFISGVAVSKMRELTDLHPWVRTWHWVRLMGADGLATQRASTVAASLWARFEYTRSILFTTRKRLLHNE